MAGQTLCDEGFKKVGRATLFRPSFGSALYIPRRREQHAPVLPWFIPKLKTDTRGQFCARRTLFRFLSISLSFCLLSCSQADLSDLNKYIASVKARPKSAIDPLPEIKVVEPFLFNPEKLRDPFVASIENSQDTEGVIGATSGVKPDPLHQKEDLEYYPLDALQMVGTVRIDSVLWGLVKAKEVADDKGLGTIHRVRVGNYMGKNYGKIIRISEDKIELMEIVPDKPGTWREQEQALPLVLAE